MPHHFYSSIPKPSLNLSIIFFLCILALYITVHHHSTATTTPTASKRSSKDALFYQNAFLSSATNYTIATYLRHLTLHPHLAGTQLSLKTALYVKNHFESLGLNTHVTNYTTLLSYPVHSSLTAYLNNGTFISFSLAEPGPARNDVVKPYHAYSPSGSVYGRALFVNHGREKDYRTLAEQGVDVNDCVAIVRRGGGLSRNAVMKKAEEKRVAAVLLYTEGDTFKDGVERGTVMKGLGDPLSPGWASVENAERLSVEDPQVEDRFPKVPSLPVSTETAEAILRSLEGARMPLEWRDTLKIRADRVGPGPTMLNFTYQGKGRLGTIHNVFAIIRGSEEPDRFVILGNHRDAWTYGAVDPNSGTASLLDIARRYSLLMRLGWSPRRTIILSSWDGEEFGMIGSTEWVEQNIMNLRCKAVAYLNVDCAVQGPGFFARATPQLDDLLVEVTRKVKDPDLDSVTVYERWAATNGSTNIERLSDVDSDFVPFLHHAGVPSVDIYFGKDFPVYHTAFDSYNWMKNSGDPLFWRHVAVTGIWGLLALRLAGDSILPFSYVSYAEALQEYAYALSNFLGKSISLDPITAAIKEFTAAAKDAVEETKKLYEQETIGNLSVLKKRTLNDRLMLTERGFLDAEGLQGREWFKHLVYGPHGDEEKTLVFFPGIVDAISKSAIRMNEREPQVVLEHEIWRVARAIQRATNALSGQLS